MPTIPPVVLLRSAAEHHQNEASMWEEIRIGDRVRQKAGGTVMIVEAHDGRGCVYCFWNEGDKCRRRIFNPGDLELVERPRAIDPKLRYGNTSAEFAVDPGPGSFTGTRPQA